MDAPRDLAPHAARADVPRLRLHGTFLFELEFWTPYEYVNPQVK